MKIGKRGDPLIGEMDAFAAELLTGAKSDNTVSTQAKIDVFRTITQWIGVKNRLVDDEGEDLDVIRAKLRSPAEAPSGAPRRRPDAFDGTGGSALAAIKRKLPRSNAGDAASDSNGVERSGASANSGAGSVRPKPNDDF